MSAHGGADPELDVVIVLREHFDVHADAANARALVARAGWEGVRVRVHEVAEPAEWPAAADLVLVGDGDSDELQRSAFALAPLSQQLLAAHDAGAVVLAVGTGFHLLGRQVEAVPGRPVPGVGVFLGSSDAFERRVSGELAVRVDDGMVLGFENHVLRYRRPIDERPLGSVIAGTGSGDGTEGAWSGNALGVELHGPVLATNPALAVDLLDRAMRRRHGVGFASESVRAGRSDALTASARAAFAERAGVTLPV